MWPSSVIHTNVTMGAGHGAVSFDRAAQVLGVYVSCGNMRYSLAQISDADMIANRSQVGIPTYYAMMQTRVLRVWPIPDQAWALHVDYTLGESLVLPVDPAWRQEYAREFRARGGKC